ncbi:hypothetical protein DICA0_E15478 [Diutina catenulata]
MTLSTRVSIQWPPEVASESTSTMVFTSPDNHFVDVRVHRNHYPLTALLDDPYTEVFEWVITGVEKPQGDSIAFEHEIDSQAIANGTDPSADIGHFEAIPDSNDRQETGSMMNPATGKVQDYVEIWRSLDPTRHQPDHEVVATSTSPSYRVQVMKITERDGRYQGTVIQLGDWVQGVVYDRSDEKHPLHVLRMHKRQRLVVFGRADWFPLGEYSLHQQVKVFDLLWTCIEESGSSTE